MSSLQGDYDHSYKQNNINGKVLLVKGKAEVKMQQENSYLVILLSPIVSIVLIAGQDNLPAWVCL